jgi:hypothetical protein
MNGRRDSIDFRRWRNLVAYLAGMGVEALFPLLLAGIAALVLSAFRLFGG